MIFLLQCFYGSGQIMPLTILSSAWHYLLCFWPPWGCSQSKTQPPDWPRALHNNGITSTYFSLLILHFPLQHYFLHISVSCSAFLNVLVWFWHFFYSISSLHSDKSADPEHPIRLVCHSVLFLSLMLPWHKWLFLTWQINDSLWASRAVSVPGANTQCHILPHLSSNPSSKPISL